MNDRKRIFLNTIMPLIAQIITMLCGFILPRFFLKTYGSEINGAVSSVAQFLGIINFLDLGVTAIIQSALYEPLAQKNNEKLSIVIAAADKFFRFIGIALTLYIIAVCFLLPQIVVSSFSFLFWVTLTLSMGINSFGQYYLGVVDGIILTADQKYYIKSIVQVSTLLVSTIVSIFLIDRGANIQTVKLAASLIFLAKPIVCRIYIKKKYAINRKIKYDTNPLPQKWNGVAQHVAAVVLDGTDVIVLTLFASLINVSIYHIYYLVVSSVKSLFLSTKNAVAPFFGKLWAKQQSEELIKAFDYYEWLINVATTLIFGCTASLLVPFVMIYTNGITDADYFQPVFALLLTLSIALYCLRLPYASIINAANHYKQTQHIYIVATVLNIVISIASVKIFGLIGVAIGTLISLAYQTIHMSIYTCVTILSDRKNKFYFFFIVDAFVFTLCYFISKKIPLGTDTYIQWVGLACLVTAIWLSVSIIVWSIVCQKYVKRLFCSILEKFMKKNRS